MKTYKLSLILGTALATIFLGCGSSDGGGSSGTELTPETAEKMAVSAANALPMCAYNSDNVLAPSKDASVIRLYSQTFKDIQNQQKTVTRGYDINEVYQGTCPTNPGSYTVIGAHDEGDTDTTVTFNNYCTGDATESTTVNGEYSIQEEGTPSDYGPVLDYTAVKNANLEVTEKSAEGTFTHTVKASNIKYEFGNGGEETTASAPDILTIGSVSAVDGRSGEKFGVSNVSVESYGSGANQVVQINSASYTDPENGTVTISSSTPITVDENGNTTGGDLLVEGANGTSMTMVPDPSVQNGYSVVVDGEDIGVMDCSSTN